MARAFDGTADYGQLASSSIWNPADVTIACWLNIDTASNNDRLVEVGGYASGAIEHGYSFELSGGSGGAIFAFVWDANGFGTSIGTSHTWVQDSWVHVCLTMRLTGSELNTYYINGVQSGSTDTTANRSASTETAGIMTQNQGFGSNLPSARMAELVFFDIDLSASQALSLSKGVDPYLIAPSNVIEYFPLTGGNATLEGGIAGNIMTMTSSPAAYAHPSILHPSSQILQFPASAAPAGVQQVRTIQSLEYGFGPHRSQQLNGLLQ